MRAAQVIPPSRRITRLALFAGLLSVALLPSAVRAQATDCRLPATPPSVQRKVYLLDSAAPAATFGAMQSAVKSALQAQALSGYVEIATFSSRVNSLEDYSFPQGRGAALSHLQGLTSSDGAHHLNASIQSVLQGLRVRPTAVTTVYVLSGGADDQAGSDLKVALSALGKARGPFDRLYLLSLGQPFSADATAALQGSGYARGLSLSASASPDLASVAPAGLIAIGPASTPLGQVEGTTAQLDDSAFTSAGAQLQVSVQGGQASASVQGASGLAAGTTALMCAGATRSLLQFQPNLTATATASGSSATPATPTAAATSVDGGNLLALNPGVSTDLRRGQSVTLRYRVQQSPVTVQTLVAPAGTSMTLQGARLGQPIAAGSTFAVNLQNDGVQGNSAAPQVVFTSGQVLNLPAVHSQGSSRSLWWLWLLLLILVIVVALAWWLRRPTAPRPSPVDRLLRPRALSVEDGEVILHGESGQRGSLPLQGLRMDLGQAFMLPALEGLLLEPEDGSARLVGLPPDLRLSERGRTVAVGDVLNANLLYLLGAPTASSTTPFTSERPAPLTVPPEPVRQSTTSPDFGRLSQDIASLGMLGGVGGLGLPRELELTPEGLMLRGDAGEQAQELPEGYTDLGEAFGVPALQGLGVSETDGEVRLTSLPLGFHLRQGGQVLEEGATLPDGALTLDVPAWLQASVDRVRDAFGEEIDTRHAGVDLSGASQAIDLDHVFGEENDGSDSFGPKGGQ